MEKTSGIEMNVKETAVGLFIIWGLGLICFVVVFLILTIYDVNEAIKVAKYLPSLGMVSAVILCGTFYYVVKDLIETFRSKQK